MADGKKYLLKLLNLAEKQNSFHKSISIFHRNKNAEYFDEAERNGNVLPTLTKDNGGDWRSPINNTLKGVFLDTTLRNGQLPSSSPFGNYRIQFPIAALFDKTTNLYFTDFYCKKTSYHHYVTLVIAKRGSEADTFCKEKLVRLNPKTNPFLRRNEESGDEPTFTTIAEDGRSNSRLHVEVFYTEEIKIEELKKKFGDRVKKTNTGSFSKGRSTPNGLPKDPSCDKCNPRNWRWTTCTPSYVLSAEDEVEPDTTADEVKSDQTDSNGSSAEEVTCKTESGSTFYERVPPGDLTNETPLETEGKSSQGGKTEPEEKVKFDQPEEIVELEENTEREKTELNFEKLKEQIESKEPDENSEPLLEKDKIKQLEEITEMEEEESKVEFDQPDMKIAMEGPEAKVEREQSDANIEVKENGKYLSTVSPGMREIIGEPKVMVDAQDGQVKKTSENLQVYSPEVLDTKPELEVRTQKRKHESSSPCDELPPKRSLIDENPGKVIDK